MGISVIIPIYNCEPWLEQSVASALQFDRVKELILIDDGSTDTSPMLINSLAERDQRIIQLSHPNHANKGRSASRNLGIHAATQPWIAFLDADDYFLPNRFDGIDWETKLDGYYGSISSDNLVDPDQSGAVTHVPSSVMPAKLFALLTEQSEHYFSIISMTIRRESLLKIDLFDEQLKVGEDTDLIWRITHVLNLGLMETSEPIAVRRVHESNIEREDPNRAEFYHKWLTQTQYPLSEVARKRMFYAHMHYSSADKHRSRLYQKYQYAKWRLSNM